MNAGSTIKWAKNPCCGGERYIFHFVVLEHDDIHNRARGNAARRVRRCPFDCASSVCGSAEQGEARTMKRSALRPTPDQKP
jgi:hypothetical protein